MDNDEARFLLRQHLEAWRRWSYQELNTLIGRNCCEHCEVVGSSGATYQISVNIFWDDESGGDVRVIQGISTMAAGVRSSR
jgi:hypothetical protein